MSRKPPNLWLNENTHNYYYMELGQESLGWFITATIPEALLWANFRRLAAGRWSCHVDWWLSSSCLIFKKV